MSNLSLKLEQKAKILQVQRLTIHMLALNAQDLADFLQEQVTDNPLLDIRYHDVRPAGDKGDKAIDNLRSRSDSLEARLMAQLRVQSLPRPQLMAWSSAPSTIRAFSRATWLPWARLIISLRKT